MYCCIRICIVFLVPQAYTASVMKRQAPPPPTPPHIGCEYKRYYRYSSYLSCYSFPFIVDRVTVGVSELPTFPHQLKLLS
jgi:hypothetical protein